MLVEQKHVLQFKGQSTPACTVPLNSYMYVKTFQEKNRAIVVQSLLSHIVVGRQVALLDQFSRDLETLGVLKEIRLKPELFEPLFVPHSKMTSDMIQSQFRLRHPQNSCQAAEAVFRKLMKYIDDSTEDGK